MKWIVSSGVLDAIRTHDPSIRNRMLYPAELQGLANFLLWGGVQTLIVLKNLLANQDILFFYGIFCRIPDYTIHRKKDPNGI